MTNTLTYEQFQREQRTFAENEIRAIRSISPHRLPVSRVASYRQGFEDAYRSLGIHPDQADNDPGGCYDPHGLEASGE